MNTHTHMLARTHAQAHTHIGSRMNTHTHTHTRTRARVRSHAARMHRQTHTQHARTHYMVAMLELHHRVFSIRLTGPPLSPQTHSGMILWTRRLKGQNCNI